MVNRDGGEVFIVVGGGIDLKGRRLRTAVQGKGGVT